MPISAAERGQHHRLDQELQQHLAFERADRQAHADLARALGDGDQHDVHDADAADQQADRGDGAEQRRQHSRRARHACRRSACMSRTLKLSSVAVGELAALAQQLARRLALTLVGVAAVAASTPASC